MLAAAAAEARRMVMNVAQATVLISQQLIDRYSAGPSPARTKAVKSLQESVRKALRAAEGSNFDTFLQGSYRNDTAIADINDVDIVALYDPWRSPTTDANWQRLFNSIATILRNSALVSGTVKLGDKCVSLAGTPKADIVPSISRTTFSSTDPIKIYSRRKRKERPNYPRTHYANGVAKQAATKDTYKATVRLLKRWVRQYPTLTAPSFYIESAVHSVPNAQFNAYLPLSFANVAVEIAGYPRHEVIHSVAGDKDILVSAEWHPDHFEAFQQKLLADAKIVINAITATTGAEANRQWKLAFGDFD